MDESEKNPNCLLTECPHGTGKKRWVTARYWIFRPNPCPPTLEQKSPKCQGKKKNPHNSWQCRGEKEMAPAPVSREKNKQTKGPCSSLGKQIGSWWISGAGPLFIADEAGRFGVLSLADLAFLWSGVKTEQPLAFPLVPADSSSVNFSLWSQTKTKLSNSLGKKSHQRIAAAASPKPRKGKQTKNLLA